MRNRRWITIRIAVPDSFQDLLIGTLVPMGVDGFLQGEGYVECSIAASRWKPALQCTMEEIFVRFMEQFPQLDLAYIVKRVREENWNRQWEQQAGIVEATPRIVIKPSWKTLRKKDRGKLILHIDPKMAFGTGHHETTRLSLLLLEDFVREQSAVLDFGCGTGILGITAAKLGAKRVWAIDNDPWAIPNARENVKRNHVEKRVRVKLGSVDAIPARKFPLIVANIDLPTITKYLRKLSIALQPGGLLILSGVLEADLERLIALAHRARLSPLQVLREKEWIAAAFSRA
jgi:ribosomal protein L11 methyltransferase